MELPFAESWKIKMVEPIRKSTRQDKFISTLSPIREQEP